MSDFGRMTPMSDPSFTGPRTNELLGEVVKRLDRQDDRMAAAAVEAESSRKRERIVIAIALATLLVAVLGVVVTLV